ncbi:MAG: L-serine ammonia-lyase, iron-sulfur-dependent, subunit beta, partial [Coprococcus sp.]
MDFFTGQELIGVCQEKALPISEIMKLREMTTGSLSSEEIDSKLETVLSIMKNAATRPLLHPGKSIGGLIGGEAKKVNDHGKTTSCVCGSMLSKAISYSMAVLEVNASMGLIVAAPTAGSSGVVPGVLLAMQDEHGLSDEKLYQGLLNASAIGYLLMRNASVSGAEAGCQAEVGAASAMSASAIVEMMGGNPHMSLTAASLALSNLLGLVCDPIAGLVESPCQSRNA